MDIFKLIAEVGFPIAGAIAAGFFCIYDTKIHFR